MGSEMCIRDSIRSGPDHVPHEPDRDFFGKFSEQPGVQVESSGCGGRNPVQNGTDHGVDGAVRPEDLTWTPGCSLNFLKKLRSGSWGT